MVDSDKLRFEVCKKCVEASRPTAATTADEYLVRMAGLFDAGALMWCKIHDVDPSKYSPQFLHELSQAALDGMTRKANEMVEKSN